MNFGAALHGLKDGAKQAREGWDGKGIFIYLVEGTEISPADLRGAALKHVGNEKKSISDKVKINGHIDMKTADGSITVGWVPSQTDMLAEDWTTVV